MNKKTNVGMQYRLLGILIGIVVLLLLLSVRIGWIQFVRGSEYSKEAALQQTKDVAISSKRGTIYDRNLNELAKSASADTVTACPREITTVKKRNEIATELGRILGMDKDKVYAILAKDSSYEVIKRKIDKDQADAIRKEGFV